MALVKNGRSTLQRGVVILFLALAARISADAAIADSQSKEPLPGDPAPAFKIHKWLQKGSYDSVQPVNGRRITVIEFWTDWRPPCRTVLSMHDKMQTKLRSKGIRFLTVAEGRLDGIQTVLKQLRLRNLAVVYDEDEKILNTLADPDSSLPVPFAVVTEQTSRYDPGRALWKGQVVVSSPPVFSIFGYAFGLDVTKMRLKFERGKS